MMSVFFFVLAPLIVFLSVVPWLLFIFFPLVFLVFGYEMQFLLPLTLEWLNTLPGVAVTHSLKALIVDDDESSLIVVKHILRDQDITYEIADKEEAIVEALERDRVDLVILDYKMPQLTGPELLARVDSSFASKKTPKELENVSIPVIGYSAVEMRNWNLSEQGHFRLVGVVGKDSPPSVLKEIIVSACERPQVRVSA